MTTMKLTLLVIFCLLASSFSAAQTPLRVAVAGLVHGHVEGFFENSLHRPDIQLVGIADPDQQLASRYAAQFHLDHSIFFTDLEDMLRKTHPQAVLAYTNTRDHRRVVENLCPQRHSRHDGKAAGHQRRGCACH